MASFILAFRSLMTTNPKNYGIWIFCIRMTFWIRREFLNFEGFFGFLLIFWISRDFLDFEGFFGFRRILILQMDSKNPPNGFQKSSKGMKTNTPKRFGFWKSSKNLDFPNPHDFFGLTQTKTKFGGFHHVQHIFTRAAILICITCSTHHMQAKRKERYAKQKKSWMRGCNWELQSTGKSKIWRKIRKNKVSTKELTMLKETCFKCADIFQE